MIRIFDPHIHMTSRTTDDYEAMAAAGVRAIVEPAFWLGQPRTCVGSFIDYFSSLVGWERFRASQFGISHNCTIGLNPKEASDESLAREVLAILPRFLEKDGVVAVGEIGFDSANAVEEAAFEAQIDLAHQHGLPAMIHTPHRDKLGGTKRTLAVLERRGFPPERTLIDHNNELTAPWVRDAGCWMGFSIYPDTKVDELRMVRIIDEHGPERILVNSAADWGRSDPLKVAKTAAAMSEAGFDDDLIDQVVWRNPVEFFSQSGRLILTSEDADPAATFLGSGLLRGDRSER